MANAARQGGGRHGEVVRDFDRTALPNKAMEDVVVKTVAGFLNTDGGTLLIGVDNAGKGNWA